MNVSYDQFVQLQNRVMLLEGGNSGVQVLVQSDVSEVTNRFDRLLTYLEKFFNVGNISMTDIRRYVGSGGSGQVSSKPSTTTTSDSAEIQELRDDLDALSRTLTQTRDDINERLDRLLNYLEGWIQAGSLTMNGVKDEVNDSD